MLVNALKRVSRRHMSTAQPTYPFSKTAIIPAIPYGSIPPKDSPLKAGKGLMEHLRKTLPPPEKQTMLRKYFSRRSPHCLIPGSILTVTLEHAPTLFTGVLLAMRRRGPASSLTLRNVVARTGVEMQIYPCSPHVKDIKVEKLPPKGRMRRAKLFYLRDSPDKMVALASGKSKRK